MHGNLLPLKSVEFERCVDAIERQQLRQQEVDNRLPCQPRDKLMARVKELLSSDASMQAVAQNGELVGFAGGDVHSYGEADDVTYWPDRMGVARELVVLGCDEGNEGDILELLLGNLTHVWRSRGATGSSIVWPSHDIEIASTLSLFGFSLDAFFAFRGEPAAWNNPQGGSHGNGVRLRSILPQDEDAVVSLFWEVIDSHIPNSPFARVVPAAEDRFRERIHRSLEGGDVTNEVPFILVALCEHRVLAMAECFVVEGGLIGDQKLPVGRYGYINSFGVSRDARNRGLGSILEAGVNARFDALSVNGCCLWYSSYNRSARQFWTKLGYDPLWTSYQCRY